MDNFELATHVNQVAKRLSSQFTGLGRALDTERADLGANPCAWPPWCFVPENRALALVRKNCRFMRKNDSRRTKEILLSMMGAWAVTRSVYRFDRTLSSMLRATAEPEQLNHRYLVRKLPQWAGFIETPQLELAGKPVYGFFVQLQMLAQGDTEMRLMFVGDGWELVAAMPVDSDPATRYCLGAELECVDSGGLDVDRGMLALLRSFALSHLTFIVAHRFDAVLDEHGQPPRNPWVDTENAGPGALRRARQPVEFWAGESMGDALRLAGITQRMVEEGRSPQGRLRPARWATYQATREVRGTVRQETELKWLPPLPESASTLDSVRPVPKPTM